MGEANIKRSQAILRMPVDMVDAVMFLHDGDRADVLLFVPPSEDISLLLGEGSPFLPVMRDATMCFIARSAIACLGVDPNRAPKLDEECGQAEVQAVKVTLRSGTIIEGTMRWIAIANRARTADHLNSDTAAFIVVHGTTHAYLIAKSHIAMVRES
jgi:hypothetical protein